MINIFWLKIIFLLPKTCEFYICAWWNFIGFMKLWVNLSKYYLLARINTHREGKTAWNIQESNAEHFPQKKILLILTSNSQGSPRKHFQMQSLRIKSCNSTKYYYEVVIMEYSLSFFSQDTKFCK